MQRLYPELRRLAASYMRSERPDHTLQPTALVHELYIKLMSGAPVDWQDRAHFLAIAARKLRHLLVDRARRAQLNERILLSLAPVEKASGVAEADILALDQALDHLEQAHQRSCRVLELRFFAGLTDAESAEVLGVSVPTIRRDFRYARAWLAAYLNPPQK
jgi:RNA polymerase sigma factor (TIGR02999 family)